MNTVCGPPLPSKRVSPPKYFEAGAEGVEADAAFSNAFSTRPVRVAVSMPVPTTAMLPLEKADAAYDLMSATVRSLCAGANRDWPRPLRKASPWATSTARVAGSWAAASVSEVIRGATYSSNSCRVNFAEVTNEVRTSTKYGLLKRNEKKRNENRESTTHASSRRNSAVRARCSLPRVEYRTPPYSSLSRTVPIAERPVVLCSRKVMGLRHL